MNLTQQEKNILQFLQSKQKIYWEELAQFSKNPSTVQLKTIQKVISDLKKKYRERGLPLPFNTIIERMPTTNEIKQTDTTMFNGQLLVKVNSRKSAPSNVEAQTLTQASDAKPNYNKEKTNIGLILKYLSKQVITNSGIFNLNHEEFELLTYFVNNAQKFVSLEELRDQVCFPKFGSKLPSRWFSSIQRRISNIRNQIPETKNRLLTARQDGISGYIFN